MKNGREIIILLRSALGSKKIKKLKKQIAIILTVWYNYNRVNYLMVKALRYNRYRLLSFLIYIQTFVNDFSEKSRTHMEIVIEEDIQICLNVGSNLEKDIGKKKLEQHPDVFADIFNCLLFGGEDFIQASDLTLVAGEEYHTDEEGSLRQRTRDVLMKDIKNDMLYLLLGCENQENVDNTMPLRCMGYDFAAYDKQVKEYMQQNQKNQKTAYVKKIHPNQKLKPVITLVLYYGTKQWDGPFDIYDMLELPRELQQKALPYIHNYKMNFIHMTKLSNEIRERFTSDFRLVAEYLCCKNDKKKLKQLLADKDWRITHIEDFLDVISQIGNDKRYEEIKETIINRPKKEEITMCLIAEELENKGMEKGDAARLVKSVEEAMKNFKVDLQTACDGIGTTIEEYEKAKMKL